MARSITTCVPAMASFSPSPVMVLTPLRGEAATTPMELALTSVVWLLLVTGVLALAVWLARRIRSTVLLTVGVTAVVAIDAAHFVHGPRRDCKHLSAAAEQYDLLRPRARRFVRCRKLHQRTPVGDSLHNPSTRFSIEE